MTTTKEKKAEYDKKRRQANPEYYSQKAMEWSKANREKVLLSSKKNWYKTKYGITIEEYKQKLENQNYCCAICNKHESNFVRQLAVDHCHATGKSTRIKARLPSRARSSMNSLGMISSTVSGC